MLYHCHADRADHADRNADHADRNAYRPTYHGQTYGETYHCHADRPDRHVR